MKKNRRRIDKKHKKMREVCNSQTGIVERVIISCGDRDMIERKIHIHMSN
jgi:hypothetical protein